MNYLNLDGEILSADRPALMADNRGYRYGDGLFETIKVIGKRICLEEYHFNRFFAGLRLLRFEVPAELTSDLLTKQVLELCEKNQCTELARIRMSVFRGNGGLYEGDDKLHYIIECKPVPIDLNQWRENGILVGIYTDARKSSDAFSHLKSANYLPYVMAAKYAQSNEWDDCLVLNQHGRIADATIANVFVVKDGTILTPPLSEGCVDGVMRRYLLESLNVDPGNYQGVKPNVKEECLTIEDILNADEIFLTNAISGIRWVRQLQDKTYGHSRTLSKGLLSEKIYNQFIKTIWK
jgi:branched-chain amino acid aminotransferase